MNRTYNGKNQMSADDKQQFYEHFSHPRVAELLYEYSKKPEPVLQPYQALQQTTASKLSYLRHANQRKWLKKKGKNYLIDFDQHQRQEMKKFFNTLDKKKMGSIGLDELQEMLLSVGLLDNRQEVKQLMGSVDEDHSGKIQFDEFLEMIQDDSKQNEQIVNFFKKLVSRHIQKTNLSSKMQQKLNRHLFQSKKGQSETSILDDSLKDLPFQMVVNQIRRTFFLSSFNIGRCRKLQKECTSVQKGKKVVQALQKMQERRIIRTLHGQNEKQSK